MKKSEKIYILIASLVFVAFFGRIGRIEYKRSELHQQIKLMDEEGCSYIHATTDADLNFWRDKYKASYRKYAVMYEDIYKKKPGGVGSHDVNPCH